MARDPVAVDLGRHSGLGNCHFLGRNSRNRWPSLGHRLGRLGWGLEGDLGSVAERQKHPLWVVEELTVPVAEFETPGSLPGDPEKPAMRQRVAGAASGDEVRPDVRSAVLTGNDVVDLEIPSRVAETPEAVPGEDLLADLGVDRRKVMRVGLAVVGHDASVAGERRGLRGVDRDGAVIGPDRRGSVRLQVEDDAMERVP